MQKCKYRSFFTTVTKIYICGAVIIAEGTGLEVNPRVDRPIALVVLALPRVCLLPSRQKSFLLAWFHEDITRPTLMFVSRTSNMQVPIS